MMKTTEAPDSIKADRHPGKRQLTGTARRSDVFTAAELATTAPDGTPFTLWEFSGHVGGQPLWTRTRYIAQGDGSLVGYDAEGARKIIHPRDREIRILTK